MTCAFSLNEKNMDFSAFEYCQKYQNNKGVVVFSHFKVGMLYITSFLVKNLNTSSIWWAIYTNSQIFVVGLPCSPQFKYDWCNFIMCELGISLTPMSFRHLHKQMKGNPLMLKVGDGGEAKQRVWIWYPLLVGGGSHVPFHRLHPTHLSPAGRLYQGVPAWDRTPCRRGD